MFTSGTASNYLDLLDRLRAFVSENGSAHAVTFNGSASGARLVSYRGGPASVNELFTITSNGDGSFSVVGSVSGGLGTAYVGAAFVSSKLAFTIQGSGFVAGDRFEVATSKPWTVKRWAGGTELILEAPGSDGRGGIYVGAQAYYSTAGDHQNWRLNGFTGYSSSTAFDQQPGAISGSHGLALWNYDLPYRFIVNGRRVIVLVKVSTVYQAAYLGLAEQFVDPAVYPMPLVVGGSALANVRWSDTTDSLHVFPFAATADSSAPAAKSTLRMRLPSGEWRGFFVNRDPAIWPSSSVMGAQAALQDGSYPLYPTLLTDASPANIYARLDGVFRVPGRALATEALVPVSATTDAVVISDGFRGASTDYMAVTLD